MSLMAIFAALKAASWVSWLSIGGGATTAISWTLSGFLKQGRAYLILGGIVSLIVAAVSVTIWLKDLESKASEVEAYQRKEFQLSVDMKCADKEDVLVCFQREQAEAEQIKAAAVKAQQDLDAQEKDRLAAENDSLKGQLHSDDAASDADQDAKKPVPDALSRAWDRKRARMGLK